MRGTSRDQNRLLDESSTGYVGTGYENSFGCFRGEKARQER